MTRALLPLLLSLLFMIATPATATTTNWPTGSAPIEIEPAQPMTFTAGDRIVIEGTVTTGPATVVLRIDDRRTPAYAERMNGERELPEGPFRLTFTTHDLRTTGGRPLDLASIHRVIFFTTDDTRPVTVSRFQRIATAEPVPAATATQAARGPALSLGTGTAPIEHYPSRPIDARGRELIIEGANRSAEIQNIVLRLDDGASTSYASRVNIEREVPPGPFRLRFPVEGLTTPTKRVIDATSLRLVILSPWPENDQIAISRFDLAPIKRLPEGTIAVALGAADAQLPPGFERIAPGDPRLVGRHLQVRRRPAPDPLVANGIRGIEQLTLKTAPGVKRVTIWSEDPGEWEHLPAVLDQTIRVNGKTISATKRSFTGWIAERYLAQRWREHTAESDAFAAFGRHRGNRRSLEVDAADGTIQITIDGATLDDRYLSAVLIEPAGNEAALEQVTADRAAWYRDNFPVVPVATSARTDGLPSAHTGHEVAIQWDPAAGARQTGQPVRVRLAPGGSTRVTLALTSAIEIPRPAITLDEPAADRQRLSLTAWAGQWRLDRTEPQDTRLEWRDDRLISDLSRLPLGPDLTRRYELWLTAPPSASPGRFTGEIVIAATATTGTAAPSLRIPLEADVLDVTLPPAAKPAGPYLAYAPHLTWNTAIADRDRQAACDLDWLSRFGLTGTAPPIATPLEGGLTPVLDEMTRAQRAGVSPGWMLYNPLHQMRIAYGTERTAKFIGAATDAIAARRLPAPVWSAADEPSNPDQDQGDLAEWVKALRQATSHPIRLAGHLNSPADRPYARLFDVVIINPGFGLDRNQVGDLSANGRQVWIYNTFTPRLTAGVWLHYSSAVRYVQWHARMPTADPLDPIDGREGDVQMFYPMDRICPDRVDIHRSLLRLADGILDQRWLIWLANQTNPAAKTLRREIEAAIPRTWAQARLLSDRDLHDIRNRIIDLAATQTR